MGSSEDYRTLLDKAYSKLPQHVEAYDRFSIPRPDVRQIGRKTVILNFKDICDQLRRDPDHLLKFLTGEMATLATFDGTKAVFQGKFGLESVLNLLKIYTEKYVICPVCKRPDTHLERQKRLWFMECEACGARSSIGTG
ncbi:translation initiation factor IF-2 subunit beta [Candidatus Bathyarchaeota archaeon]|nr:translation initiation factor IF-2 subunit beta [Candidatus Bathyarchaeota archaeon]MBS7630826.1 translation initiation factor IF-2 subunit beta [Candidatus Bathyarchaeota archaeon]